MNNNTANSIKDEDYRAFGKFILILVISLFVGGAVGLSINILKGDIADMIGKGISGFLSFISPYALVITTIIITLTSLILYKRSSKKFLIWDGENEDDFNQIEANLGVCSMLSSLNMISTYFFFAVGITLGDFEDLFEIMTLVRFVLLVGGLFISLFAILSIQRVIINFEKKINPEKKGSIFDTSFAKKWTDSCDEAQKLTIYMSAYKSFQTVNMTCIFLWVFCIVGSLIWNFGVMPVVMVIIIWTVLITSYHIEACQLSKNLSKNHR